MTAYTTVSTVSAGDVGTATWANGIRNNILYGLENLNTNLLTNGGFEIWQRGAGAFTATGAYTADRWSFSEAGTDAFSITREGTTKKDNSLYSAACAFTLGSGAGASRVSQVLSIADLYHGLLGQTICLTMSVKLFSAVASAVRIAIATDGTGGTTSASSFHGTNTDWEDLTVTGVVVPTDATVVRIDVLFAASVTAYLDNAMLVIGAVAPVYQPLHPAIEWARAERYYEVWGGEAAAILLATGQCTATTTATLTATYPRKAIIPTLTKSAAGDFVVLSAAAANQTLTDLTFNVAGYRSAGMNATIGAANLVAGNATLLYVASTSGRVLIESNP